MRKAHLILFITLIVIALLLMRDIYDPKYSYIGDEYAFFNTAKEIAEKGISFISVFSQQGVFGYHPMLDSVFQALFIKLYGANLIGWKITNIIVVILSISLVFDIAKTMFGDIKIALSSAIFFGFSHYLLSFAHIGYNSLHSLLPFLLTILFFCRYFKNNKYRDIFIAGFFSGLCFYTFYSARFILILTVPFLLIRPRRLFYYILGFLILFTPFLLVNQDQILLQGLKQTLQHPEYKKVIFNTPFIFFKSLFSGKYAPIHHFFIFPILSLVSAVFFITGIVLLVKTVRKNEYKFLFLFCWALLIPILITTTYFLPEVPTTRLHIILPALSIIAGYGIGKLINNKSIIFILLFIYAISELYFFYFKTFKIHPINPNALILSFAEVNKDKTICVYDEYSFYTPTSLVVNLYHAYNIRSININNIQKQGCDFTVAYSSDKIEELEGNNAQIKKKLNKFYDEAHINYVVYY